MINSIEIIKPDDMHLHLRDNEMLKLVLPYSYKQVSRAVIMPNLIPPLIVPSDVLSYKKRILELIPRYINFTPLMTLYLTENTSKSIVKEAKKAGVLAFKLYPANATTNSEFGVKDIFKIFPILEEMNKQGLLLLIHGEVTDNNIDIFDREKVFIEKVLIKITDNFPELKIVLEHITTKVGVDFIEESNNNIAASVTVQHLLLNRNDLLVGGIKPHNYCLPILKKEEDRKALLNAIIGANSHKYFMGTDSAPHLQSKKENSCGCAGVFSSPVALELYAYIFENLNALDKLEAFTSKNGANFYNLPINTEKIELIKEKWEVPDKIGNNFCSIIPFWSKNILNWKIKNSFY